MKLFYIALNIFLFIMIVLLTALNLTFKPHAADKILTSAPDFNKTAFVLKPVKSERETVAGASALWENNLFSPYRSGDGGPLLGGARPVGMELLGVSRLGDIAGAIIIDKTPSTAPAAMPSRIRGNRGPASVAAPQANAPKFWKLGEQLQNGFFLSEVNSDSVVLSRGREQIVLKLDYSSQESLSRNASAAEAAAAVSAKLDAAKQQEAAKQQPPVQPGVPPAPQPAPGGRQKFSTPIIPPQPPQADDQQDQPAPQTVRPE